MPSLLSSSLERYPFLRNGPWVKMEVVAPKVKIALPNNDPPPPPQQTPSSSLFSNCIVS
jgi:hypothetical protein